MSRNLDNESALTGTESVCHPEMPGGGLLKPYEPPRLECYGKLDEVVQFYGSKQVDSGSGLGNPPLSPP